MIAFPARLALVAVAGVALLGGLTGSLVLLGVQMPRATVSLGASHGILMTLGFLGTLIALERAVALGRAWGYLAPLAAGLGALALLAGAPHAVAVGLIALAAGVFAAMYVAFDRIERSLHTTVQGVGAVAWLVASVLVMTGWPTARVVPWLAAFLVLTIAGERLELSRLGQLSGRARIGFVGAAGLFALGVVLSLVLADFGVRLAGVGLVATAGWLARNDLARRTVRGRGVTRFVAISLLAGYVWLTIGGLAWAAFGLQPGGAAYDAMLHAVFLGFVISMVLGHAPIILPAVLRRPLPYHPRFYIHLALLHGGLLVRLVGGDLLGSPQALVVGGILNVTALLVFMASSAAAIALAPRRSAVRRPSAEPARGA